jgi:hypothetical protein
MITLVSRLRSPGGSTMNGTTGRWELTRLMHITGSVWNVTTYNGNGVENHDVQSIGDTIVELLNQGWELASASWAGPDHEVLYFKRPAP